MNKPCETYKISDDPEYDIQCSLGYIKQRTCDGCSRNKYPVSTMRRIYTPTQKKAYAARMKKVRDRNMNQWKPK